MTIRRLLGTSVFVAACALAQSPLSFEVASVKPAAPPVNGRMFVSMGTKDPGRLNWTNVSLRDMIRQAYQLKDYQISGPDSLDSQRFDLAAKIPEGSTKEQTSLMLQTLLAERFKLTVHHENRDLPAYALVVAKGGLKMKEFVETPDDPKTTGPNSGGITAPPTVKFGADGTPKISGVPGKGGVMFMTGMGKMQANGVPVANLTDFLSRQLDRPVVDETGLTAKYDISLNWTPEPGEGGGMMGMKMAAMGHGGGGPDASPADPAQSAPPLPVALQQQLGLKLEQKKLPLDMLVVDHAEKVPTEN